MPFAFVGIVQKPRNLELMYAEPRHRLERQSLWTPLHQAVFNNAPLDILRWLIENGAFRMIEHSRIIFLLTPQVLFALELRISLIRT